MNMCIYTYMHETTVNGKKDAINLKKDQGEVHERIWRKEREEKNDVTLF